MRIKRFLGKKLLLINITQFFVLALWTEVFFLKTFRLRGSVSNALDLRPKGPWFNPGWGRCPKKFCVRGFSNVVFWNPLTSSLKVWIVFFIGLNFLFKSILAWCGPNQRQGAFLGHLKCPNHPKYEAKSCSTQKVGFSKWCPFFDLMHFRPWPLLSGGFI